jgi:beta-mannosidase
VEGATVNIEVSVNNLALNTQDGVLRATLAGETFESESLYAETNSQLEPGGNRLSVSIPVSKARLWWPWDMGEPDLYQVDLELIIDGERQDSRREVFGIREIRMEMNPGFSEDEVENPWTFMINGKRHFLRSACWGGPPSFFYGRNTDKKYSDRLEMVREANINNLRIFGWHPPEIPYFYEFCDRLGISVWTNFSFATQAFEATPEFMEPMLEDCRAIVRERRNHPSNIFWMGGEEVFFSDAHVDSENKLIMEEVGRAVAGETSVPYCPASPMSGEYGIKLGFKPKESAHANEHYYAAAEHTFMEEYYTALDYCVIPELTAASAPSMESLRKFIPMDELWPMGPSWGYHWADISILRILNCEVFGSTRDGSLEDFVASTQLAHGIIAQFALEHFRRRKPRVSAVALCHFLTYLPDIKWGIIDYYGEKKIAFDHVKRAYQPLLPSLEVPQRRFRAGEPLRGEFWVVNDYQRSFEELQLEWRVLNPAGVPVEQGQAMFSAAADSSAPICPLAGAVDGQDGQLFRVEMILRDAGGTILAENFHTLAVGDQERAKAHCVELHREMENEKQRLGKGYYRYHPELIDLD